MLKEIYILMICGMFNGVNVLHFCVQALSTSDIQLYPTAFVVPLRFLIEFCDTL